MRDGAAEAVIAARAAEALLNTDAGVTLQKYFAEIGRLERVCDDQMNQMGHMVKQIRALERRVARNEGGKAAA